MDKTIKVGIGVAIIKDNKILLGHRVEKVKDTGGIYEPGSWTCPGGKQEYDETIEECAIRETKEETNLNIKNLELLGVKDDISADKHFITISFMTTDFSNDLQIMEEDKIDKWEWFDINNLPKNIYSPSKKTIEMYLERK